METKQPEVRKASQRKEPCRVCQSLFRARGSWGADRVAQVVECLPRGSWAMTESLGLQERRMSPQVSVAGRHILRTLKEHLSAGLILGHADDRELALPCSHLVSPHSWFGVLFFSSTSVLGFKHQCSKVAIWFQDTQQDICTPVQVFPSRAQPRGLCCPELPSVCPGLVWNCEQKHLTRQHLGGAETGP
jgi:hypothetical protein